MKIRLAACLFLLTAFSTAPAWARANSRSAQPESPLDRDYIFALAAANHFLHAWQTGDLEAGTLLLSDRLRHSQNADKLEQYFSNGTNRAFEITRGHGRRGRYRFPAVLVTLRGASEETRDGTRAATRHLTRKFSEIILVDTGKNDWVVDKLP